MKASFLKSFVSRYEESRAEQNGAEHCRAKQTRTVKNRGKQSRTE